MPLRQGNITSKVDESLISSLKNSISSERWKTYERAAGYDQQRAHALYLWNAAVGQSFHFPLQAVEVCLRNGIHKALQQACGDDWCNDTHVRANIAQKQEQELSRTARRRRREYNGLPSTPQILSSLPFGFWIAMLHMRQNQRIWQQQLKIAFPQMPQNATIRNISDEARRIKDLRNRIFHQEPLLSHDLSREYSSILLLLGWMCSDTKAWVRKFSSVPNIIRQKP